MIYLILNLKTILVHWCHSLLPANQGRQGLRSKDWTQEMADELGTPDGGSHGSTPGFARVCLLLEDGQHQTRGLVKSVEFLHQK